MHEYKENDIITGCVTGIEKYGIFISLENYYSGLIHISEVSNGFVKNLNDYVKIGETIKVQILSIDERNHHLKLSIKNIDYRMNKRKKTKIEETPLGFSTLKENLNRWTEEKKEQLIKNL